MPKFFVTNKSIKRDIIEIKGTDVNHIKNVLRKKKGETITVCNTNTLEDYLAEIEKIEEDKIQLKILNKLKSNSESNIKVTIFQGLPKADKMELIIQKSVELGVYEIIPTIMKRCIVKLDEKDKVKKIERWQKISEVASKQCGRNIIPIIKNSINIKEVGSLVSNYDIFIVAYENEKQNKLKFELENLKNKKDLKIAILIGPEGGIEESEVNSLKEKGAKIVTLGDRILRTETVALNILSIIMYQFEND